MKPKNKHLNVCMPYEVWSFLKDLSKEREQSMTQLIVQLLENQKNKYEIKLK